jgi:hypothetical protein
MEVATGCCQVQQCHPKILSQSLHVIPGQIRSHETRIAGGRGLMTAFGRRKNQLPIIHMINKYSLLDNDVQTTYKTIFKTAVFSCMVMFARARAFRKRGNNVHQADQLADTFTVREMSLYTYLWFAHYGPLRIWICWLELVADSNMTMSGSAPPNCSIHPCVWTISGFTLQGCSLCVQQPSLEQLVILFTYI